MTELSHQNLSLLKEKLQLLEIYTRCYFVRFISSKLFNIFIFTLSMITIFKRSVIKNLLTQLHCNNHYQNDNMQYHCTKWCITVLWNLNLSHKIHPFKIVHLLSPDLLEILNGNVKFLRQLAFGALPSPHEGKQDITSTFNESWWFSKISLKSITTKNYHISPLFKMDKIVLNKIYEEIVYVVLNLT